jgi:hypothetical protein
MEPLNMAAKIGFDFGFGQPFIEGFCGYSIHKSEDTDLPAPSLRVTIKSFA